MLILGIILIVLALLIPLPAVILWLGIILAVVGGVLLALSFGGREVGGRRYY
jgi:membrane-bound ClpP family serine protease